MEEEIKKFLEERDYDIRKSHNSRWIDQKCTMDVISVVADCILEYLKEDTEKEFTVKDIWFNKYTIDNVQDIFKKPNPEKKAKNEYDKWFGQPIKLFANAGILIEMGTRRRYRYKLNNKKILEYIALKDRNSYRFLCMYIEKVLKDSGLLDEFNLFFEKQDKDTYKELKKDYRDFITANTPIKKKKECGRIFTKIVNPLAYSKNKKGSIRGRVSKQIITFDELFYNRPNWRDVGKDKDITRNEFEGKNEISFKKMAEYKMQKARNDLKAYNETYRDGKSEVEENGVYPENAIHIHHIFPKSDFPEISYYLENLIALTPNQHFCNAHPNGNTQYIDKEYQYTCILYKIKHIRENLEYSEIERIYEFKDLTHVLDVGFHTDEFEKIENLDFDKILEILNKYHKNSA